MTAQGEIPLKIAGPEITPEEIDAVCVYLRGKGWVLSRTVEEMLRVTDRHLRTCAEHSDGRIISGQKGYRLFDAETPLEDADRAASWLESQGKKMLLRAATIRRRYHRYARERVA